MISDLTKLTGYRLTADESSGIGSLHRLAYSLILIPTFLGVSEAFSDSGIGIGTTSQSTHEHRIKAGKMFYLFHGVFNV